MIHEFMNGETDDRPLTTREKGSFRMSSSVLF